MIGKLHSASHGIPGRIIGFGIACLLLLAGAGRLAAAHLPEAQLFGAAANTFHDNNFAKADEWFAEFLDAYPKSPRRLEAILGLAESRYFLKTNSADTIQMLSTNLSRAGKLGGDYLFWIGEIHFQNSNYLAAATNYARVWQEFASSTNALGAAYSEAFAYSLLGQTSKVVQLLATPSGAFQNAAKTNAGNPFVARGVLLLAGIYLDQKNYRDGEAALGAIAGQTFGRELDWRRQELVCRFLMEEGRLQEALAGTTNLMSLARLSERPESLAQSFVLKAGIYERLNEFDLAESAYTNNFAPAVPPQFRRGALLKVIELDRRRDRSAESVGNLEAFAGLYPQDPILDAIQFTLGEVRLKEYYRVTSLPPDLATNASTNLLVQAITNFSRVIDGFQRSPLVGKSLLDRAWCWWGLTNLPQATVDFGKAVNVLPAGEDQDLARFKLAESEVQSNDSTNAVKHFHQLIAQHAPSAGSATNALIEQALTEMLNAAITIGDQASAEEAFTKISRWFPESPAIPWATLSYGGLLIKARPAYAREEVFKQLLKKFPDFSMVPEVRWAIARTYKREEKWTAAMTELDQWVKSYPSNTALPQVEFERAILYARHGDQDVALNLFTNFVARFSTHTNAPAAQFWVGDHYFNDGQWVLAETTFENLYRSTNWAIWPPSDLRYLARLSAGQAAIARQGFKAARDYLTELIDLEKCPPLIRGSALFELGNVSIRGIGTDPIFKDGYGDAINSFENITRLYQKHPKAGMAEALIGSCHYQKASEETLADQIKKRLDSAIEAYTNAMNWPGADITTRSFAEFGLAQVLERQNKPDEASAHLANVFYTHNGTPGEHPDASLVKESGLELAKLFEAQQNWAQAKSVWERLGETFPPLRANMALRIERIQKESAEK